MPAGKIPFRISYPVFLVAVLLCACATISKYDQYAYSQATSIKVDALNVMDLATNSYKEHEPEVRNVMTSIDKMYEYEKNRPKNDISTKMWGVIKDTSGHLYGGFIKRWQKEDKLNLAFIQESKKIIGESFDQISQLESGKIKPAQATTQ
jgi:hypothetical protein